MCFAKVHSYIFEVNQQLFKRGDFNIFTTYKLMKSLSCNTTVLCYFWKGNLRNAISELFISPSSGYCMGFTINLVQVTSQIIKHLLQFFWGEFLKTAEIKVKLIAIGQKSRSAQLSTLINGANRLELMKRTENVQLEWSKPTDNDSSYIGDINHK